MRRRRRRGGWIPDQHHPGASRHPSSSEEGSLAKLKRRGISATPFFSELKFGSLADRLCQLLEDLVVDHDFAFAFHALPNLIVVCVEQLITFRAEEFRPQFVETGL